MLATISHSGGKDALAVVTLLWLVVPAHCSQIAFEHAVIDAGAIGHREVGDIDADGFNDISAVNTKGAEHIADRGKESHLGTRVADMDNDGDLDIVSVAWDYHQYLHLWRNDTTKGEQQ